MPIGDSITMATCYRARLAQILDMKHKGDWDFVGTQKNGGCGITFDPDNEGHGAYLVTQHTSEFASWAAANTIDVMLLHFATNDCWNSLAPAKILSAYTTLVTEFRKKSPNAVFLVAQLIPLTPAGCDACPGNVKTFNAAIPAWAQATNTAASPVIVVDEWTGYDSTADNRDGVHPNDTTGSTKMATKWDEALEPLF
jgi:mannan endo-1,4-beta-mannosidase